MIVARRRATPGPAEAARALLEVTQLALDAVEVKIHLPLVVATEADPEHDVVDLLRAPVLGLYGAEDTGIPLDSVEKMRAALATTNNKSRIDVFDGAPHGFHADYRPSYHEASAREGWKRMLEWFKANGV